MCVYVLWCLILIRILFSLNLKVYGKYNSHIVHCNPFKLHNYNSKFEWKWDLKELRNDYVIWSYCTKPVVQKIYDGPTAGLVTYIHSISHSSHLPIHLK